MSAADFLRFSNGVIPFVWNRMPLEDFADIGGRSPSLAEDWFVEEAINFGSQFVWRGKSPEESHRLLYRFARGEAHRRGEFGGEPQWLLLHQMIELLPALFFQHAKMSGWAVQP